VIFAHVWYRFNKIYSKIEQKHKKNRNKMSLILLVVNKIQNKVGELGAKWSVREHYANLL